MLELLCYNRLQQKQQLHFYFLPFQWPAHNWTAQPMTSQYLSVDVIFLLLDLPSAFSLYWGFGSALQHDIFHSLFNEVQYTPPLLTPVRMNEGKFTHQLREVPDTSGKSVLKLPQIWRKINNIRQVNVFQAPLSSNHNHYWTYWKRFLQEAIHPFPSFWSFWRTEKGIWKSLCRSEQLQDKIPTKIPSSLHQMTHINAIAFCQSAL